MSLFNSKESADQPMEETVQPRLNSPVRKPIHESAALFAQEVVELQQSKHLLEVDLATTQSHLANALASNNVLRTQLDEANYRLDYYYQRVIEIETKLAVVSSIVIEVFKTSPVRQEDRPSVPPIEAGVEAIAEALKSVHVELAQPEPQPEPVKPPRKNGNGNGKREEKSE